MQRHRIDVAGDVGHSARSKGQGAGGRGRGARLRDIDIRKGGGDLPDVRRAGAAASAHDARAPLDEGRQRIRKRLRRHVIDRATIHALRHARVGQHRDRMLRQRQEAPNGAAHLLRPRGAVQADHVHGQRGQRRQRRLDARPGEHATVDIQGDLRLDRHALAQCAERPPDALDRGLQLQEILLGLQQQQIDAALD